MTTEKYKIVDGPSKFDLMNGLFDGKIVTFSQSSNNVKNSSVNKFCVMILSIEREDGSNNSWNLKVYVKSSDSSIPKDKKVTMYYDSRTRTGTLTVDW